MRKRITALLLSLLMVLTVFPDTVWGGGRRLRLRGQYHRVSERNGTADLY